MATVKLYLDTRRIRSNNLYPLSIIVRHNNKAIYFSTGYSVAPEFFNEQTITQEKTAEAKALRIAVQFKLNKIETLLQRLDEDGKLYSMPIHVLKKHITKSLKGNQSSSISISDAFHEVIELKHTEGTKRNFRIALRAIEAFAPQEMLDNVNKSWLIRFDNYLIEQRIKPNTRNSYLARLRNVINYAIDMEYISIDPFRRFKLPSEETKHRALSRAQLNYLRTMLLPEKLQPARDFFFLSYFLIGINPTDLVHLKKDDYKDGRIQYRRAKTDKRYDIKVEPEAAALIEQYQSSGDALVQFHNPKKRKSPIPAYFYAYERIAALSDGVLPVISPYWARHSWATEAASLGVTDSVIAQALGHSNGFVTTRIYIKRDNTLVDRANRQVIDAMLHYTEP